MEQAPDTISVTSRRQADADTVRMTCVPCEVGWTAERADAEDRRKSRERAFAGLGNTACCWVCSEPGVIVPRRTYVRNPD